MIYRYAIIENGVVANIAESVGPLADNWFPCDNTPAHIGGVFDGTTFSAKPAAKPVEPSALSQILAIEARMGIPRSLREWMIGVAVTPFIKDIEEKIEALRKLL